MREFTHELLVLQVFNHFLFDGLVVLGIGALVPIEVVGSHGAPAMGGRWQRH